MRYVLLSHGLVKMFMTITPCCHSRKRKYKGGVTPIAVVKAGGNEI